MPVSFLRSVAVCVGVFGAIALWGSGSTSGDAALLIFGGIMLPIGMLALGARVWAAQTVTVTKP